MQLSPNASSSRARLTLNLRPGLAISATLILSAMLAGCGNKGDLFRPEADDAAAQNAQVQPSSGPGESTVSAR